METAFVEILQLCQNEFSSFQTLNGPASMQSWTEDQISSECYALLVAELLQSKLLPLETPFHHHLQGI